MQVDVKTSEAVPTNEFINVTVDGVANLKISSNPEHLKKAAEALQAALEKITGFRPEIVTSPIAGSHNFTFKPMSEGKADDFAWEITGEGTAFRGDPRAAVRDYLVKALGVTRDEDGKPVFKLRKPLSFDALKGAGKAVR